MPRSASRPRLALIVTDAYAFNVLGRGQLEYFKSRGVELSLYCGGSAEDMATLRKRELGRVTHIPFRRPPHPLFDFLALALLLWWLSVRRYDGVVSSTPKAMLLGSIAAALTRQPNRTALVRGRAYETDAGLRRKVFLLFDRIAFACSHRVIFVSRSLKDAYLADGGWRRSEEFAVLGNGSSNGIDLDRFKPVSQQERSALRERLGVPEDRFVILVAGRIAPDKGIAEAIELIHRLQDVPELLWVFVGGVEDDELYQRLRRFDPSFVRHHAHTARIADWFAAANLHFMPSKREGLGNVMLEAAACGVPTIGFKVVGVIDGVADGVSGRLFEWGDLDGVEAEIRRAAADPRAYSQAYSGARQWVAERFEQRQVWDRYLTAYVGESARSLRPERSENEDV